MPQLKFFKRRYFIIRTVDPVEIIDERIIESNTPGKDAIQWFESSGLNLDNFTLAVEVVYARGA